MINGNVNDDNYVEMNNENNMNSIKTCKHR